MPKASVHFFSHYTFYYLALRNLQVSPTDLVYVFFTHYEPSKGITNSALIHLLKSANGVITMNSAAESYLVESGLKNVKTVVGGADSTLFNNTKGQRDFVGLCSSYYPRKRGDLILGIVDSMPDSKFLLLGAGWDKYYRFSELIEKKNFAYLEVDYKEYPKYFEKMKVFLSTSLVEGGPIPLIETMMSGAIPVVSDTGFARDIIRHGENGYVFSHQETLPQICEFIREAWKSNFEVASSVNHCDWNQFSYEIERFIRLPGCN